MEVSIFSRSSDTGYMNAKAISICQRCSIDFEDSL